MSGLILFGAVCPQGAAQVLGARIASAPAGVLEAGVPPFLVLGSESIGLSSPPTDLHLMPDGRVLVVAATELAFGDGVRWDVFPAAPGEAHLPAEVAVDADGAIYSGVPNGICRIQFTPQGTWTRQRVAMFDGQPELKTKTLFGVAQGPDEWAWHSGSGIIMGWKPGQKPHSLGSVRASDGMIAAGGALFASDQSSGGIFRLSNTGVASDLGSGQRLASEAFTAAAPYAAGVTLIGTGAHGLELFDGETARPFPTVPLLGGGHRIADLCVVGDRWFAAAVDAVGIVFFDHDGRLVQVLDRMPDHRLARARRLRYAANGTLWALLNDGLARISFPSPVSRFDPLVPTGLKFVQPLRYRGDLWMLTEGKVVQAVYDTSRRLERMEDRSPPGEYTFTLATIDDSLFATSELGIFERRGDAWVAVVPGLVNARLLGTHFGPRGVPYVARGQIGLLRKTASGYDVTRTAVPPLGDSYNAAIDAHGVIWLELGTTLVGRVELKPDPVLTIFGSDSGLANGWVELSVVHGIARFHVSITNRYFRFDDATQRFVEDREIQQICGPMRGGGGRPTPDASGRYWFSANDTPQILDLSRPNPHPQPFPIGFTPVTYTAEDNGVVWAVGDRQLARIDPRVPEPPAVPIRALITAVQFSATGRTVYDVAHPLGLVPFADNSLVVRFAAPANPFTAAVTFEVRLEGAGSDWVSTGTIGSATFNRLKEGHYVFHVRPVTAAGPGVEAVLPFDIAPPWFRSNPALAAYGVAALAFLAGALWVPAYLQRRDKARLERIVTERTEALGRQVQETTEKSQALAASEERFRRLNADLERRVDERTAELTRSHNELQQRESLFRLIFEHAPVGISWKRTDVGDVYHFNPTFQRILALTVDNVTDYSVLLNLVGSEDAARWWEAIRRVGAGEIDDYRLEQRFVLPDERVVWGSLSVAVIRDASGRIVQDIGILEDITARKAAEQQLAATYKDLVAASRVAGMAEVATGVLHNVGNALNSLNVSSNLLANQLRQSKAESLVKLGELLNRPVDELARFLTEDAKGRRVPELVARLGEAAVAERNALQFEITSMQKAIDHIKEIVAMQQSYATVVGVVEPIDAVALFEDALRMNESSLGRSQIRVERAYQPCPAIMGEKGKMLQILNNIIRNAKHACDDAGRRDGDGVILLRTETVGNRVRLQVTDNGVGIPAENLTRIFAHGFTTRSYGHGFGLHSSALAAQAMGGSLTAASEGAGRGATFILEIPMSSAVPPAAVETERKRES